MEPRVLRTVEAANYIGISPSSLEKLRLAGKGPRYLKLGARSLGYDRADLDRWLDQRRRATTPTDDSAA